MLLNKETKPNQNKIILDLFLKLQSVHSFLFFSCVFLSFFFFLTMLNFRYKFDVTYK